MSTTRKKVICLSFFQFSSSLPSHVVHSRFTCGSSSPGGVISSTVGAVRSANAYPQSTSMCNNSSSAMRMSALARDVVTKTPGLASFPGRYPGEALTAVSEIDDEGRVVDDGPIPRAAPKTMGTSPRASPGPA